MICCTPTAPSLLLDLGSIVWDVLAVVLLLLLRFVTGLPLTGRLRSDCTYLRRGTVLLQPSVAPWLDAPALRRWACLAGYERQAIRLSITGAASMLTYGCLVHPVFTALAVTGAAGTALAVISMRRIQRVGFAIPIEAGHNGRAVTADAPYAYAWPPATRPATVTGQVVR